MLNKDIFYVAGTANETIHYTAGGSTVDWMYSVNITPFVVEVVPPCDNRWCLSIGSQEVHRDMERYGCTGRHLIDLVTMGTILSQSSCTQSTSGDLFSMKTKWATKWKSLGTQFDEESFMQLLCAGVFLFLLALFVRYYRWRPQQTTEIEAEPEEGVELNRLV